MAIVTDVLKYSHHVYRIAVFMLALCICSAGYLRYADISMRNAGALYHKELGKEVSSGTWLTSQDFGKVRTPGYPMIIGTIYTMFGDNDLYVMAMQVVLFSIIAVVILSLGNIVFGRLVGLLSAVWYITYYDYVRISFLFLREIWTTLFILLTLLFYVLYFKKRKPMDIICGTFSFGCLVITDPRYSCFLFILLLFVFLLQEDWPRKIRDSAITVAGVSIFLAPWAVHQSRMYDRTVIFSPYYDAKILSLMGVCGAANDNVTYSSADADRDNHSGDVRCSGLPSSTETQMDEHMTADNSRELRTEIPRGDIGTYVQCFLEYWRLTRFKSGVGIGTNVKLISPWSLSENINNIIHIGLLLPFVFIGVYLIVKKKQLLQLLLLSFLGYHMILHVMTFYLYRYRLHILPVLFLMGWYGADYVVRKAYVNR